MAGKKGPIPGVIESNGRYYRNVRQGARKVWLPLTRVDAGLPALLRALADLVDAPPDPDDTVPKLIEAWERDRLARYAAQTQVDTVRYNKLIGQAFAKFRARDVSVPDVVRFLGQFEPRPKTHNMIRGQLRELMRWAELLGWREPGSNPTAPIRTLKTPSRTRYISDSELRRIKRGALVGDDGLRTESGPMTCMVMELLYLTGQAIGDVLRLDVGDVSKEAITFRRHKVAHSTGAAVTIVITPRLKAAIDRLMVIREAAARRMLAKSGKVPVCKALIVNGNGQRAGYSGFRSAWDRACVRAGIVDANIHDLKAKALTDVERARGMPAARRMGQHSTEAQTATYVRARAAERVRATR
jgi:integrase